MEYTIDTLPGRLTLGRQTETGVNDIRIDMSEWLKQWPELAISIWPTRPGEKAAYPADTYMDGSSIIWRVNSADTAIAGSGTAQIMGVADGQKKLSKIMTTYISNTTTGVTTGPPAAAKPWADSVAVSAASAQQAAQRAENAAGEIKGLSAAAQTLKAGQAATAEYADGVLTLGIPRGPQGDKGDTGAAGPQGKPGRDGTDATVTAGSIRAALGYEPADAAAVDTKLTEPAEGLAVGRYFRVAALDENGHAVLEAVDAKTVGVQDVQVAGASVVADGVAKVPIAAPGKYGVTTSGAGIGVSSTGALYLQAAIEEQITSRSSIYNAISAKHLDYAVKAAMCDGKGAAWTADEQAAARERMGIPGGYELIEEITLAESVDNILRYNEPDGTAYNLVNAFVSVFVPIQDGGYVPGTIWIYFSNANNFYAGRLYVNKSDNISRNVYLRAEQRTSNGIWLNPSGEFGQENMMSTRMSVYNVNTVNSNIYGIHIIATLPAGTIIQIYGVKA